MDVSIAPMLQLDAVAKQYQRRGSSVVDALRPTTLEVAAGDFVAIVGPSGSGKSTMLSMLGGMLAPSSGRVILNGDSVYEMSVTRRSKLRNHQIGFVFQNFNLVPWLNAIENVQLPLSLAGVDREYQREQASNLLTHFGLANRMEHKPTELSAGQQQRVAMARTLAMNPRLILADEPTGNLDPESRDMVLQTLAELREDGRAIILVTHDVAISDAAQRVFRIADGTVTEIRGGSVQAA